MELSNPELPNVGVAPATVPGRCADLTRTLFGADPDAVEQATISLAAQLKQLGWQTTSDTPGSRFYSKDGRMLALDQLIGMIAGGYMSYEHWEATCAADGISELLVPVPMPTVATTIAPFPVAGFDDPFEVAPTDGHPWSAPGAPTGGGESALKRLAKGVGLALLVALSIYIRVHRDQASDDHLAGHVQSGKESEVAYDGRLAVDGGRATSVYAKAKHEFESVDNADPEPGYPKIVALEKDGISSYGGGGRNYIDISHARMTESLASRDAMKQWINGENVVASSQSQLVSAKRSTMAGGAAWVWEYTCSEGCWNYAIRAPRGKDVYSVRCQLMPSNDTPEARARCKQVAKDLKITGGPS